MKRIIIFFLVLFILLSITVYAGDFSDEVIKINKDGSVEIKAKIVIDNIIDDYTESVDDSLSRKEVLEEFEDYIKDSIKEINDDKGYKAMVLKKYKQNDEFITMKIKVKKISDIDDDNFLLKYGMLDTLYEDYLEDLYENFEIKNVKTNIPKDLDMINDDNLDIIIIDNLAMMAESYKLSVPGKILYVSDDGVENIKYNLFSGRGSATITDEPYIIIYKPVNLIWLWILFLLIISGVAGYFIYKLLPINDKVKDVNINAAPKNCGYLTGLCGEFRNKSIKLSNYPISIGRDPSSCQLVYDKDLKGISRTHCSISYNENANQFTLIDLSSYGTFLADGSRLTKGNSCILNSGDRFYIADNQNMFIVEIR